MINEYPEHMNYVIEVGYRSGSAAVAAASTTATGSTVASNNMTDDSQLTAEQVNELPATAAGIPNLLLKTVTMMASLTALTSVLTR